MVSDQIVFMFGSRINPTKPSSDPPSIHGRRRPQREVVRSDSAPASGFPMTDPITPTPVTIASAASLPVGPEICSDIRGRRFCRGAKNATMMPRLARASPAMNRPRTFRSGSARASTCTSAVSLMPHRLEGHAPGCAMFIIQSTPNLSVQAP